LNQFNQEVAPGNPTFNEVVQARRLRLVRSVYKVTLAFVTPFLSFLIIVMLPEGNVLTNIAFINVAGIIPVVLIAYKLIDWGHMKLGFGLYAVYLILLLVINTTILQGISPVLIPGSVLVIVLTGMLLGPKHGYWIAAVASVLYIITKLIPEGMFPAYVDPGPWPRVYVSGLTIMAFIFIAVINQISVSDLRKALDDATYKLHKINQELERANERKSQFTARTSHELRTPLSSMIAFTDLGLRGAYGPVNNRLKNALEHIYHGAKHLKTIIKDILDLGKIEAGELEIHQCEFEIEKLVSSVTASIQPVALEKNLKFGVFVSPGLPKVIIGDQGRINQILMNLTSNAVKFTDEGSVSVKLAPYGEGYWSIEVKDTGPGIPEDQYEAVFQAYRQVQRTSGAKKVKGTGLGLAITRNLAELMGGRLEFESAINEGTTFLVILPLSIPDEEPQD
jgi:signal transduction histidine kinase